MLGLRRNEVRLEPYTQEWTEEFNRTKKELIDNTGLEASRIEHIGSTAIGGMRAKPIIDIVVGIDDLEKADKTLFLQLAQAGFLRLKVERPEEIVLAKFKDESYEVKTHFIHLTEYEGELWSNLIFFRDYLIENEEARNQYSDIKLEYASRSSEGINEYTNGKESFVKRIFSMKG